jgi:hypothetical protein
MMVPHHHVHAPLSASGQKPVCAVVRVGNQDVSRAECIEQFPQQGGLAGSLARIGPNLRIQQDSRSHTDQHHTAENRKAEARLLGRILWILGLIGRCVRRRDREAIDHDQPPTAVLRGWADSRIGMPLRIVGTLDRRSGLEGVSRDRAADLAEHFTRDLPPRSAVSSRVGAGDDASQGQPQRSDPHDRRQATPLLGFEEDLREQSPQRDGRRVDGVLLQSKRDLFLLKNLGDPLIGHDRSER